MVRASSSLRQSSMDGHRRGRGEDRLCWAVASLTRNSISVDIFRGEQQVLDVADFGTNSEWVVIPLEAGWSSSQTEADAGKAGVEPFSSRVFLRSGRDYRGTIKIASANTRARIFEIAIGPSDTAQQLRVVM